ncbi:2-(3-amino-3-carboxypropyl)histidine synthase subunit [Candidatus Woesearchaeota archaeon]|nr:2-(3-amino-3-carboxypropyl)histidine synthase subunit [Candidatus Woesearchaeota archaeon]
MKTIFIEGRYKGHIKIGRDIEKRLPEKIGLVSSIQFLGSLQDIKKQLAGRAIIGGQVLGCNAKNAEKMQNKVDAFLYIGDGQFHPLGIAIKTKKTVFTFNPISKTFDKVKEQDIKEYKKRKKTALLKFLHSENIGVLVSAKPGQHYGLKKLWAEEDRLRKKYRDKRFYTFIADTIDYSQLENFPFIEAWVNTACPRMEEDIRIADIRDI